jgi:hypothetical protein
MESEWASFHPMDNTGSTCITPEGINKLKELSGRDDTTFEILDFKSIQSADAGEKKVE